MAFGVLRQSLNRSLTSAPILVSHISIVAGEHGTIAKA
jgi:hypothetical protein